MADILEIALIMMAVCSPALIIIFVVMFVRHRFRMASLQAEHLNRGERDDIADMKSQLSAMKERISVLEAIVTDSGYQLQEQFKKI